jgi:hypothetical protein
MDRHIVGLPAVNDLVDRIRFAFAWRREYARVSAELGSHTKNELAADLRLSRGDIPEMAARAADEHVAALSRARSGHGWADGPSLVTRPVQA